MAERKSNFPFGAKLTALQKKMQKRKKKKQEIKGEQKDKLHFFMLRTWTFN